MRLAFIFAAFLGIYLFFAAWVPTEVVITGEEFAAKNPISVPYSNLVTMKPSKDVAVGDDGTRYIDVKLFGIVPVRRIKVELLPFDSVILGGQLLGFRADIAGTDRVATGLGTLTYVNPENLNFAAMGHKMNDYETGKSVDIDGGRIYQNQVIGVDKSVGKKVGTYRSSVRGGSAPEGDIHSSNDFGVYGCLRADSELGRGEAVGIISRYNVVPGRAKLRTTLDNEVREFCIEIVKTRFQKRPSNKSMIIRIVDKELLAATGGIVHGMSGSPILQNGKIVGALTHVVLGDASKGYGIYVDFIFR